MDHSGSNASNLLKIEKVCRCVLIRVSEMLSGFRTISVQITEFSTITQQMVAILVFFGESHELVSFQSSRCLG